MRFLILILAAFLLAGAAIYFMSAGDKKRSVTKLDDGHYVLVAQKDLLPGQFIQIANAFRWQEIVEERYTEEQIAQFLRKENVEISEFDGAVVRRFIAANAVVSRESLVRPGEGGFMSAVLYPGKRAISVAVNVVSGNAGFLFPGDKVDLLLTHRVETPDGNTSYATETFVENVRVLAIDQKVNNPDKKATVAKTITIEVSPKEAEEILVAEELGKISLILRSSGNVTFNEVDDIDSKKFTQDKDVSKLIKEYKPAESSSGGVTVTRGGGN